MKKMILSVLVSILAATAFAGNEGPQAAPEMPTVLVERTANGGFFVPPGAVSMRQIQIISNGDVVKSEYIRGEKAAKTTVILELSSAQVEKVMKLVDGVKPGKMIDPNPQAPGCQDAPSFSDAVYQGSTRIEIALTAACKEYVQENATPESAELIKILDGLEKIK